MDSSSTADCHPPPAVSAFDFSTFKIERLKDVNLDCAIFLHSLRFEPLTDLDNADDAKTKGLFNKAIFQMTVCQQQQQILVQKFKRLVAKNKDYGATLSIPRKEDFESVNCDNPVVLFTLRIEQLPTLNESDPKVLPQIITLITKSFAQMKVCQMQHSILLNRIKDLSAQEESSSDSESDSSSYTCSSTDLD